MTKKLTCILLMASVSACGGESTSPHNQNNVDLVGGGNSKLEKFLSEAQICQILDTEAVSAFTTGQTQIKQEASAYRDTYSCTYSWPRPDAEERQKKMLEATVASMRGESKSLSMRERMTDYQITISVRRSQRKANSFVPPVLTEAQMQAQIDAAKQRTAKQLTESQKALAGDAADDMVERLIRQNNENQRVDGIGDAAYWSNLSVGSMQILDRNVELSISPMLADSKQADMDNAKQIAVAILD